MKISSKMNIYFVFFVCRQNGVHFSTPQLDRISERYHRADEDYRAKQQAVVAAAMETALTYLPLAEAASELVAELDVLLGFATAASLAPREYVRPAVHESAFGAIRLLVSVFSIIS